MHNYKTLKVWNASVDLSVKIHSITKSYPSVERYNLIDQMNRCSISIASNIAEGAGRTTARDFHRFLGISQGSSFELETQLIISYKLNYINTDDFRSLSAEIENIQKMLFRFMQSIEQKLNKIK